MMHDPTPPHLRPDPIIYRSFCTHFALILHQTYVHNIHDIRLALSKVVVVVRNAVGKKETTASGFSFHNLPSDFLVVPDRVKVAINDITHLAFSILNARLTRCKT